MSNANISFVQGLYAAFGKGDIATLVAATAPDVKWDVNGSRSDFPTLGTWNGSDQVKKFFEAVGQHLEAKEFSPREFFGADDHVFVIGHADWKIRKNGRSVASDWVHIFTIRDSKIVRFREFSDTAKVAQAYQD